MTDAEQRLWSKLRFKQLNGCRFYRQKVIGNYIVDFFCPEARLIIEVDGSQHFTAEGLASDEIRDAFMAKLGYRVLRFTDTDVLNNTQGVIETISALLVFKGKTLP